MNKKPIKVLFYLIIILVSIFMVGGALIYSVILLPPVQRRAVTFVENELNKLIVGKITIGKVKTNLFSYLELVDLSIRDKENPAIVFSLSHLRLRYYLPGLFKKRVRVLSAQIDRIDANLSVTHDGKYKIPFLPTHIDSSSAFTLDGWDIRPGTLHIKEINATFNDTLHKMYTAANGVKCQIRFFHLDSAAVQIDVPNGYFYSPWWHGQVDSVSTQVVIQKNSLHVKKVFAKGSSSVVNGYGRIPFDIKDNWDLHATVSTNIRPVYALRTYAPFFGQDGHVELSASWTGTFYKPFYSLKLNANSIVVHDFTIDSVSINETYDEKECINSKIRAFSKVGDLSFEGKIKIPNLNTAPQIASYDIETQVKDIKFPKLVGTFRNFKKIPGDSASLKLHIQGTGCSDIPRSVDAYLGIFQRNSGSPFLLTASLENHAWEINTNWSENRIAGNGSITKNGKIDGTINGEIRNPLVISRSFLNDNIYGNLFFNTLISGSIYNPEISADIKSNALMWHSIKIDTLNSTLRYNKKLFIERAHCSLMTTLDSLSSIIRINGLKGKARLVIDGSGPIEKPDIKVSLDGQDVEYRNIGAERCSGEFVAHGTDGLDIQKLRIEKKHTLLNISGSLNYKKGIGGNLEISSGLKDGQNTIDYGKLKISGVYNADSIHNLKVVSSKFNLTTLNPWIKGLDNLSGEVTADAYVDGAIKNPSMVLNLSAQRLFYRNFALNKLTTVCSLQDSSLSIDSTCLCIDSVSKVYLKALLPLRPGKKWTIEEKYDRPGRMFIQSDCFNIKSIAGLLKSDWQFDGNSVISLNLEKVQQGWLLGGIANLQKGSFDNYKQSVHGEKIYFESKLGGTLENPSISYSLNSSSISSGILKIDSTNMSGDLKDGVFSIDSGTISLFNGGKVKLSAEAPFQMKSPFISDAGLNMQFSVASFPLNELNEFVGSELIRDGTAFGNGSLTIKNGQPLLNGKIHVEKGTFYVDGVEPSIGPINAEINLKDDTLQINKCKGKWGSGGSIDAIGFVIWSLDSLKDVAINAQIKNAEVELPDVASGRILNSHISFSKRKSGYLVSGVADLGAIQITRDVRLTDLVDKRNYSASIEKEKNKFLQDVDLHVKLNLVENPIVDMNLGYMDLKGDISLTGTASDPTFTGEISVVDGYVWYLDRKFTIVDGQLSNYNQYELNPSVNFNAKTDVNYTSTTSDSIDMIDTVYLNVHGDLKKLAFNFRSAAGGLTEADIISVLTLGQPLGYVGGDIKKRIKSFAGQELLGFGTKKLEQFLGVDRINIKGDIFDMTQENSPTLTVTKRISPKLMVTYETAIANLSNRKISAYYRLTKHFYLQGETENNGESGIDLMFKYSK